MKYAHNFTSVSPVDQNRLKPSQMANPVKKSRAGSLLGSERKLDQEGNWTLTTQDVHRLPKSKVKQYMMNMER